MMVSLALLLVGCGEKPVKEETIEPQVSSMFVKVGSPKSMSSNACIRYRIDNIIRSEIESLRYIINDEQNETAKEYLIIDQSVLDEFKTLLIDSHITDSGYLIEKESISEDQLFAFEVEIKNKESLSFKGNNSGFCFADKDCVVANEKMNLIEFFKEQAQQGMDVLPIDLSEQTVKMQTWADYPHEELEKIMNEEDALITTNETEIMEFMITDNWTTLNDKWKQALKMVFYINDEFSDYHMIKDWDKISAGLAMQVVESSYSRTNVSDGNTIYRGPKGDRFLIDNNMDIMEEVTLQPINVVNDYMVEEKGKILFGNDFTLSILNEGLLSKDPLFNVGHHSSLELFIIQTPYEYWFGQFEHGWVFSESKEGNKRSYDMVIFETKYGDDENRFISVYVNELGEEFYSVSKNMEHFKQVRIVLEETKTGIRINSFSYLNKIAPEEEPTLDENNSSQEEIIPVEEDSNPPELTEEKSK